MNQSERRQILIRFLLNEQPEYQKTAIPQNSDEQKKLPPQSDEYSAGRPSQRGISEDSG